MGQFQALRMELAVRSTQDTAALVPALREQWRAVDADLPLLQVRAMEEVVDASLGRTQVMGALLGAMAALGLGLAGLGLYGVLAYSVSQRTRELGIRVALGATDHQVLWLVVGRGVRLATVGVVLGLGGAVVLARGLSSMLYGVETLDWVTFTAVPLLLGAVALLASWLPARRALRVPPHEALRADG
jgi:ABC-type antimicrobial peptide transport system permease subunit